MLSLYRTVSSDDIFSFSILGCLISSGYPVISQISRFARCPQANFSSWYPPVFGILRCLVSSGVWYPLVFGILWFLRQYHKYHNFRSVSSGEFNSILWYLVSSGFWYPLVFGILKCRIRRYNPVFLSRKDAPICVTGALGPVTSAAGPLGKGGQW